MVLENFAVKDYFPAWWRHQMETFSALLAICAGNSPVAGESPARRPVTRSLAVFFDLHLNKRLSKQSWGWWFETLSCPLWRHNDGLDCYKIPLQPRRTVSNNNDISTITVRSGVTWSRHCFSSRVWIRSRAQSFVIMQLLCWHQIQKELWPVQKT